MAPTMRYAQIEEAVLLETVRCNTTCRRSHWWTCLMNLFVRQVCAPSFLSMWMFQV